MTPPTRHAGRRHRPLRLLTMLLVACGAPPPEVNLQIRLPADRGPLAGVTHLSLSADRDGRVIATQSFPGSARYLSLSHVPYGPRTTFALDGLTDQGDVVGRGRTCPIDFEGAGPPVPMYFAPPNFFSPTVGAPLAVRWHPVALPLDDGTVLFAGGGDADLLPLGSSELFAPGPATFRASSATLDTPRLDAEVTPVAGVGALVTGGVDQPNHALGGAEIYSGTLNRFVHLNGTLAARFGHRAVTLPDGRVLITGGSPDGMTALATSVFVSGIRIDGTAILSDGPSLTQARHHHAAVVAVGVPVLIGGYGSSGTPLSTIEALEARAQELTFAPIASLQSARADATATLLTDGSILIVGGVGDGGAPRADAEVYNPITRATTVFTLGDARSGHTATLLADGRVLVAGGTGLGHQPLASVELFAAGIGFLTEHSLGTPRAGHVVVPLCDGTVLVVGGGPGAELYAPPAR